MASDERHDQEADWASQLSARLETLVGQLRNYSVRPALGVVRFLLVGAVGVIVGTGVLVALVVAVTKLFDVDVFKGRVWATDFLFGGMLLVLGGFFFRAGVRRKDSSDG